MSCYQWCGLTWLLKEMVKWVVFGSAWRASQQWPLQGAARIPPPGSSRHPNTAGKVTLVTLLGTGRCAGWHSTLEALWDRDNFFCLLCLLTAWRRDRSRTGLPDHKQIQTNSSGQWKNQVASQSRKWNICAVVNCRHSVPHTALEIMQFAVCLQKYNGRSLLLCYRYSISWYWLRIKWRYHQTSGETFIHPRSKTYLTRQGGQNEA